MARRDRIFQPASCAGGQNARSCAWLKRVGPARYVQSAVLLAAVLSLGYGKPVGIGGHAILRFRGQRSVVIFWHDPAIPKAYVQQTRYGRKISHRSRRCDLPLRLTVRTSLMPRVRGAPKGTLCPCARSSRVRRTVSLIGERSDARKVDFEGSGRHSSLIGSAIDRQSMTASFRAIVCWGASMQNMPGWFAARRPATTPLWPLPDGSRAPR